MGTSVPQPTFGPNGFIIPAQSAILNGATADINAAFGGNLNPSPATPQGQLAASEAAIIGFINAMFLQFTNLVDPALSSGRMQDAIARIYFIERIASSPTVAQCLCVGLAGVAIPAGAQAQGNDGNIYICTQAGAIGAGGNVTLPFAALIYGPIVCPENNIQTIFQAIPGWDSINNPTAGVTGNATETAQQFEARRALSVAHNSQGWLAAVIGAVLSVPGVIDAFATENNTSNPLTIGGYSLAPNSIYVAVVGGSAQAVAEAIFTTKAPGSVYNGNTSETVFDTNPLYTVPPSYTVLFETPAPLPFLIDVTMASNSLVPSNAATLVQNAIIAAFAGNDGGPRARIGSTVYASRFYAGIASAWVGASIISILLNTTNSPAAAFTASIVGGVMTVSAVANGALATGQTLFDTAGALIPGTTVGTQLTGSPGSTGTYDISNPQTVGSESMVGVVANLFDATAQIDQAPAITAANIVVSFV